MTRPPVAAPRGARSTTAVVVGALALAMLAAWIAGCWRYSSVGIDHDSVAGDTIVSRYVRVRWPGDGSMWIGGGWFHSALGHKTIETLDPAARILDTPRVVPPRTLANRWGFWWMHAAPAGERSAERWLGVPGWLPSVILGLAMVGLNRRRAAHVANPSR